VNFAFLLYLALANLVLIQQAKTNKTSLQKDFFVLTKILVDAYNCSCTLMLNVVTLLALVLPKKNIEFAEKLKVSAIWMVCFWMVILISLTGCRHLM